MMVFMPTPIGLQDLAALIARQSFVSDTVRQRLASPFGTIHAATYTMPRPLGTIRPIRLYTLAAFDPMEDPDITGSIGGRNRFLGGIDPEPPRVYPTVNRTSKGDRLVPADAQPATARPEMPPVELEEIPVDGSSRLEAPPPIDTSLSFELPLLPVVLPDAAAADNPESTAKAAQDELAGLRFEVKLPTDGTPDFADESASVTGNIFFGNAPLTGPAPDRIEPWAPGTKIVLESPDANDPDLKHPMTSASIAPSAGETVASKGEVTGAGKRPRSPAERLGLLGSARAKAEKCLTDAVYFEARGEPANGQIAVAQVVMNRVFSGFYPTTVCGVVYQNAHRRSACQFTFACDGIPDRVTEPDAWARAKQIAHDTLDGKLWLKLVGKSTHYHAYWVRPRWVGEMMKLHRLGVHTFYRPRAWGDGADAPVWGDAAKAEAPKSADADEKPTQKM
jgi:spore germination cell wall hydrolase CwlJ-like protein